MTDITRKDKYYTKFKVSNPSAYIRNDYVEVALDRLKVPETLDESVLKLSRLHADGSMEEIPFQIDELMGNRKKHRMLTFLSGDIQPSGSDRYDLPSAEYLLEAVEPGVPVNEDIMNCLWVEHYYDDNIYQGIRTFDEDRPVTGIKFFNSRLAIYLCLTAHPIPHKNPDINFKGAVTSVDFADLKAAGAFMGEMLAADWEYEPKRWGQMTHTSFFPLPWVLKGFEQISLSGKEHRLIYSHSGPVRAVATIKIGPLEVIYDGAPLFNAGPVKIDVFIYRIFYIYRGCQYYIEELLSETREGTSVSFRPYFRSLLHYPYYKSQVKRFENIPDYFSIWKSFGALQQPGFSNAMSHRGFGFAADAHVRQIRIDGDEISWRLPFSHHNKCIHYFMQHGVEPENIDLFHAIGHNGWYEKVFKPLEPMPYSKRFPAPSLDDFEPGERI